MPQGPFHWPYTVLEVDAPHTVVLSDGTDEQFNRINCWTRHYGAGDKAVITGSTCTWFWLTLHTLSCIDLYLNTSIKIPSLPRCAWVVYAVAFKQALRFWTFWGKSEACRERMCEREGREKEILATDLTRVQATQLATLTEDRFLWLWEIKHCLLCGFFQRINLETLIPRVGTKDLFKASKQKIIV